LRLPFLASLTGDLFSRGNIHVRPPRVQISDEDERRCCDGGT
jgi:hypothetical protein